VLKDAIRILNGNVTIAGETAPHPGILVTNSSISIQAPDVTIRNMAIRCGDGPSLQKPADRDSLKILTGGDRALIENCSISWGVDENLSVYAKDVTIRHNIISEGLHLSIHTDADPNKKGHSMGVLVYTGARNVRIVRNLFAFNRDRNPRFSVDTTGEVVNNVIASWGDKLKPSFWNTVNLSDLTLGKPVFLNVVGNYFLRGSGSGVGHNVYAEKAPGTSRVYIAGNSPAPSGVTNLPTINVAFAYTIPVATEAITSEAALGDVLANAGSRPWARNPVDTRIIAEVLAGTGSLKNTVADAGGYDQFATPLPTTPTATATPVPTMTLATTATPTAIPTEMPLPLPTAFPTETLTPPTPPPATPTKVPAMTPTATRTPTPIVRDIVTMAAADGDDVTFRVNGVEALRFTRSDRLNVRREPADLDVRSVRALREFFRTHREFLR